MAPASAAPSPFALPPDSQDFAAAVIERCEDLIAHGIWTGVSPIRLRSWLRNFVSSEEKYFAACLLDALIYRSKPQTIALMRQLLTRVLPDLFRSSPSSFRPPEDWIAALQRGRRRRCRLCLVPVVSPQDPPTKSGYVVARMLKQEFRTDESYIINPEDVQRELSVGVTTFLFIDDFLGTGVQFADFFNDRGFMRLLQSAYVAYLPLAAHEDGIRTLRTSIPWLHVRAVELLDDSHSLFHDACGTFNDGVNSSSSALLFYHELLRRKGIQISGPNRTGFGHLELAYAFEHAVPDNCLPILWWDNNDWKPLFPR